MRSLPRKANAKAITIATLRNGFPTEARPPHLPPVTDTNSNARMQRTKFWSLAKRTCVQKFLCDIYPVNTTSESTIAHLQATDDPKMQFIQIRPLPPRACTYPDHTSTLYQTCPPVFDTFASLTFICSFNDAQGGAQGTCGASTCGWCPNESASRPGRRLPPYQTPLCRYELPP